MTQKQRQISGRRKGQTLAEFALTLPVLLILLFGIIEFGRIFQAWVTLQNAARAAARYTATGLYDEDKFQLDLTLYEQDPVLNPGYTGDLNSIVPCAYNERLTDPLTNAATTAANLAQRGTLGTVIPYLGATPIQVYQGGVESIYATYYGGDDCDPGDPDDQNRRKDLARILSIYDEARIGAAGLALGPQQLPLPPVGVPGAPIPASYPSFETLPWFYPWYRPFPGDSDNNPLTAPDYDQQRFSNEAGWFDVMVCSNRPKLNDDNSGLIRFQFPPYLETGLDPRAPVCPLREVPTADLVTAGWTSNYDVPWWDAGGPGDTVAIVITFNHPLVTPLGIAPYVPLQARRIAVNEAFRRVGAFPPEYDQPTPPQVNTDTPTPTYTRTYTPSSDTATYTPTFTPTHTATNTQTYTPSFTPTFACSNLTVSATITYSGDRVIFTLNNSLPYATELRRVTLAWQAATGYTTTQSANAFFLRGSPIWVGSSLQPLTDIGNAVTVGAGTPAPAGAPQAGFSGGANLILPTGNSSFEVRYVNGPVLNAGVMPEYYFNGTTFYYDDLGSGTDCAIRLNYGLPTNTPTPGAGTSTVTNTPTPSCQPNSINVGNATFEPFLRVRYDIVNTSTTSPASIHGFGLQWVKRTTGMTLVEVWGGGSGPGSAGSTQMWSGTDTTEDTTSGNSTSGLTGLEGTWLSLIVVPPTQTRSIYFVFGGGSGNTVAADFGSTILDFDNTFFVFDAPNCPNPIATDVSTAIPTPIPTSTFTATFTPTSTATFTRTFTPSSTPTFTPTFTRTFTPTHTLTFTRTFTPTFTPPNTLTFTPTFTRTFTPSNTPTFTLTFTPSSTPTFTRTFTPTFTPSITQTFTQTFTPSQTRTFTPTFTPSQTRTFTPTFTRTFTPTFTLTFTPSSTPTFTRTFTPTFTPSSTPTFTQTFTPSQTRTFTPTFTRTFTPTFTQTFTPSQTRTFTPTFTRTFTPSSTPTFTRTFTPSSTPTFTPTFTPSSTRTFTPTFTRTYTLTFTPTFTQTYTPQPTGTSTFTPTHTPTFTRTPTITYTPSATNTKPFVGGG